MEIHKFFYHKYFKNSAYNKENTANVKFTVCLNLTGNKNPLQLMDSYYLINNI